MHLGLYRHFKGGLYRVIGTAIHSETGEIMVIYFAITGAGLVYTRPRKMFLETVDDCRGSMSPRFKFIEDGDV